MQMAIIDPSIRFVYDDQLWTRQSDQYSLQKVTGSSIVEYSHNIRTE
jgi:hypothetical protein